MHLGFNISTRAVSSAVERLPYKQVVIGSNPIPPTLFIKKLSKSESMNFIIA